MGSQFGALLRGLRHEAGMTQEQLAERSRLGVRTIHRLETGKPTDARMGTVKQVAHALADELKRDRDELWTDLLAAHRGKAAAAGEDLRAARAPGPEPEPEEAVPEPERVPHRAPEPDRPARPAPHRTPTTSRGPLAEAAESLAHAVYARCIREEEQRRIHDPFPLPVRWRSAPADLLDHRDNIRGTPPGAAHGPLSLDGGLADIADVYRRVRSGRLVVLGRAGSGKTVLVLRFVLDHLVARSDGDPVPVVFSMGSWDPTGTTLRDWLIARLLRDHPNLGARAPGGATLAAALVDAGWILPVLDGFDEMATGPLAVALRELNASSLPLLLTSRTEQFAEAVGVEVLRRTAGIELLDLDADDLVHYLPRTARPSAPADRDGRAATGWDPVLERLRTDPDGGPGARLRSVLSTPLMVLLARTAYSDTPAQDPAVLLDEARFPTPEAIEEHLLAGSCRASTSSCPRPSRAPAARAGPVAGTRTVPGATWATWPTTWSGPAAARARTWRGGSCATRWGCPRGSWPSSSPAPWSPPSPTGWSSRPRTWPPVAVPRSRWVRVCWTPCSSARPSASPSGWSTGSCPCSGSGRSNRPGSGYGCPAAAGGAPDRPPGASPPWSRPDCWAAS
ncbi:helix-turn-helix domain-containing protein [Streptomyces virginiae]|uniref:helix-turn-helix domain-containing protein n=1 Tax=Streptomyces virginiae TaxID=1961 RepID=UPI0036B95CA4